MSEPETSTVDVNGEPCRVWRKGKGPKLGFLAGFGGLPRWTAFLDRLAETRTVIAPSIQGFPGAQGHHALDSHLDWMLALRQLLDKSELAGADLVGATAGGGLAADLAAIWPSSVRRLALIAPWGLFDEKDPMTDPWAQRGSEVAALLCAEPANWTAFKEAPAGANSVEWPIEQTRANEAAARIYWPLGSTHIERRLPLIQAPTLLLRGDKDRVLPQSYIDRFAKEIAGKTEVKTIAGAGHLAELDKPDEVAAAILAWTD